MVLSSGFRTVIDPLLAHWGFAGLDVEGNDARFTAAGRTAPVVRPGRALRASAGAPASAMTCGARAGSRRVVYIGDGISDRCVARIADVVFARAGPRATLAEQGVPFLPFEDFDEVRESASRHLDPGRLMRLARRLPPAAAWGAMEERVLAFWRERDVFPRTMSQRAGEPPFVFYEGPPTANGRPGVPPRAVAGVQGHLPPLPDHARPLR